MPTIRVSKRTYDALKGLAEPFEDTPDAVIGRLLEHLGHLPPDQADETMPVRGDQTSVSTAGKTPQRDFRKPLLEALRELGGRGTKSQVCELVPKHMQGDLREGDYEEVSSGEPRWVNAVAWERKTLVDEGLLRSDSPRGVWELLER